MTPLAFMRAQYPIQSLGFGSRIGVWFQGCSIHCLGCIVPESWTATSQHMVSVEDLVARLEPWLQTCDGITISGGEPFDQPVALAALLQALRARTTGDLLVYSGYVEQYLLTAHAALVGLPDVVVAGPFRASLPDARAFVGSRNQTLLINTNLGRERYENLDVFERRLDFAVADGEILFAGVPRRGELERIVAGLLADGVEASATHVPI